MEDLQPTNSQITDRSDKVEIKAKFFQASEWISRSTQKKKQQNQPCKRWGHTAIMYEKYMYIFGGCGKTENSKLFEAVFKLDCETYEWEKIVTQGLFPETRDSHSCCRIGNKMYIYGGSTSESLLNEMWTFQFDKNIWKLIETKGENTPMEREGHSVCVLEDRYMLVVGGWNSDTEKIFDDIFIYDTSNNTWRLIDKRQGDQMSNRESQSATLINGEIFIFGGQGNSVGVEEVFLNDMYKIKIDQTNNYKIINTIIKQIKPKNSILPSPRSSHSAVGYQNRYLIIIGGEGYPTEEQRKEEEKQRKVTEKVQKQEHEQTQNDDDDEKHIIYPKNDIWIYDTIMNFWQQIEPKSRYNIVFFPRITHSCVAYKDQLLIFGGMRNLDDILDDLMVLQIKDDEEQSRAILNDTRKICSTCHFVFGLKEYVEQAKMVDKAVETDQMIQNYAMVEAAHQLTKIEEEKKTQQQQVKIELKQEDNTGIKQQGNEQIKMELEEKKMDIKLLRIKQPSITIGFLSSIANTIQSPFTAIGMLVDNAIIRNITNFNINLCEVQITAKCEDTFMGAMNNGEFLKTEINKHLLNNSLIYFQISDESEGFTEEQFIEVLQKMDYHYEIEYDKINKEYSDLNNETRKSIDFSNNLKLAGLRLGKSMLIISKNKQRNILNVAYLSATTKNNPNLHDYIIFMFCYDKKSKQFLTENGEIHKSIILHNIQQYITEDQLMNGYDKGNFIYIFDLVRIPRKQGSDYEFQYDPNKYDLYIRQKGIKQFERKDKLEKLVDYSLNSYLQHQYLKFPENLQIFFNTQKIEMVNYAEVLKNQKDKNKILKEIEIQNEYKELKDIGKVSIYEVLTQEENGQVSEQNTDNMKQLLSQHQGILLYYDGKLIGRGETEMFGSYFLFKIMRKFSKNKLNEKMFNYVGVIELAKFLKPNLFKQGIEFQYYNGILYTHLKSFMRYQKANDRKKIHEKQAEKILNEKIQKKEQDYEQQKAMEEKEKQKELEKVKNEFQIRFSNIVQELNTTKNVLQQVQQDSQTTIKNQLETISKQELEIKLLKEQQSQNQNKQQQIPESAINNLQIDSNKFDKMNSYIESFSDQPTAEIQNLQDNRIELTKPGNVIKISPIKQESQLAQYNLDESKQQNEEKQIINEQAPSQIIIELKNQLIQDEHETQIEILQDEQCNNNNQQQQQQLQQSLQLQQIQQQEILEQPSIPLQQVDESNMYQDNSQQQQQNLKRKSSIDLEEEPEIKKNIQL